MVPRRLLASYKNQPPRLRAKAVEIANRIIQESSDEGIAIATGLKCVREYIKAHPKEADAVEPAQKNK